MKLPYKPFKKKYVICEINSSGTPEVSTFTNDNKGNRIPLFLDTKADAVIEIADHMKAIADAVKRGNYYENRLEDAFEKFIAEATLSKQGHLIIINPDGKYDFNVIFDDSIVQFIIQHS